MKIKTKKARLIVKAIVCIVLSLAILVPATMFSLANDGKIYTSIKDLEGKVLSSDKLEYYDLEKGVYTSKQVTGPDENGEYTVTIDTYTSDVTYISANKKGTLDIMVILDNSQSMSQSFSGSIFAASKQDTAKKAIQNIFSRLVGLGAGTSFYANVRVYTFSNKATDRTKKWLPLNESTYKEINSTVAKIAENSVIGGTDTRAAFEVADEVITARQKENPKNTQVLLFLTDGVPSLGATLSGTFEADIGNDNGTLYANAALKHANKLKAQGVTIFSIGVDSVFEKDLTSQNANTLCKKITDGYTTSALSSGTGTKILEREAFTFMNIMSSGWLPVEGAESMSFDWNDYDASSSKSGYNNSQKDQIEKGIYKKWARNEDSWQLIPQYYTIAPDNGEKQYYFGDCTDEQSITAALYQALVSVISTHIVTQGSLLGDYSVKDTVSSYFEIVPNSAQFYKVEYTGMKNTDKEKFSVDDIEDPKALYGATKREFNEEEKTPLSLNYTATASTIEIPATKENSSLIDAIVVDDLVDSTNEKHSGNKLRITYKIRPKDSFMGGSSVPTHDYANSGIYKEEIVKDEKIVTVVQSFDKANSTETNPVPKMSVELVWTKHLTIRLPNSIPLKKVFRKNTANSQ